MKRTGATLVETSEKPVAPLALAVAVDGLACCITVPADVHALRRHWLLGLVFLTSQIPSKCWNDWVRGGFTSDISRSVKNAVDGSSE